MVQAHVAACITRHVPAGSHLTVALSGGLDSVVLLHVLSTLRAAHAVSIDALHVDHGLSPNAGKWAAFCAEVCARSETTLNIEHIAVARDDPDGIEGAARRARRAVFAEADADFLLTAHHEDDQAETLLLQLLRGSGPKGLAGMAECQRVPGWQAVALRPLLGVARRDLRHYAEAHALDWIEDESNADPRFRRNALRLEVLPLIEAHFPGASGTLARAATLQAEAAELLDDLARLDRRGAHDDEKLDCAVLAALPPARGRNLLRAFIAAHGWPQPPARRLAEALRQLCEARPDADVNVALGPMTLHRYRRQAYLVPARDRATQPRRRWQGQGEVELEAIGKTVRLTPTTGAGIKRGAFESGVVELGVRVGREALRLVPGGPHRKLRHLMQEAAVPPWERDRTPLLLWNGQLVWADGVGIDADFRAAPGEPGVTPEAFSSR